MTDADSLDIQNAKEENQELKKNVSELLSQVEELKNEVKLLNKKLKKTEYEKENAEGHVKNLKRDLDSVRKEFYEEKKKWKQEKEALAKACQREEHSNTLGQETSKNDNNLTDDGQEKDIKTVLEEAAEQAMTSSGFVYDERTGLYYDWSSGLYYDSNSCLYYNNQTGTYYFYNKETNSYEFHSQVELPTENNPEEGETEDKQTEPVKKKKKLYKPKARKKIPVIKIKSSSDDENSSTGEIITSDDDEDDSDDKDDEEYHSVAPCIRAIVTESDKLKIGTLFIVTCIGGTLGREKDVGHTIRIPDVAVSKNHCKFVYDDERRQYFIKDLASRNGSFLNGEQFGQTDKDREPQVLTHRDSLAVGGTTLEIHIHQGNETCDQCEPGLLQAKAASIEDQQATNVIAQGSSQDQRKKLLKNLKKAYGLAQEEYSEGSDILDKRKYRDRADLRRVKVGSDAPNQPDAAPASVHRPINNDNKGRKMMEKMGWKDGEGLGKDNTGLKEPVLAAVHEQSRGLGSGIKRSIDAVNPRQMSSSHVLSKTRERYEQILKTNQTRTNQPHDNQTVFVPQTNKESENEEK